jgi:uncharacterized membrane protein HdeD (DUF308 family)
MGGLLGWKAMLGLGLVTAILGLIVTFHPWQSLAVIASLVGVLLLVSGLFQLVRAFEHDRDNRVWTGIVGLLFIVTGVVLIRHLNLTVALIGLIVGFTWIAQGVAALIAGFSGVTGRGSGWSIFFGIISLVAGIVVVSAPITSIGAIAILTGIWFAVMGIMEVIGALVFRSEARKAERIARAEADAAERRHARDIPGQRAGADQRAGAETRGDNPASAGFDRPGR